MKYAILALFLFPLMGVAQPELEREVLSAAGGESTGGSSYTIGEAMSLSGQIGGTQILIGYQQGQALPDSAWPGDANDDLIADNLDLLAIGLAYGTTGPSRPNASNLWQAQAAIPWLQGLPGGVNFLHPDCNGDGIINDDDTLAISLNYGLIHQKNGERDSTGLPIVLSFDQDTIVAGQKVAMTISLGTDSLPADEIYGLAFRLEMDTSILRTEETEVIYLDSWLGDVGPEVLTLQQPFTVDDRIHMALTRKNQVNRSGFGAIASVIIMIDDLSGKNGLEELLEVSIVDAVGISANGEEIPIAPGTDSLVVTDQSTSLPPELAAQVRLYPNPTSGRAELDLYSLSTDQVIVRDLYGKEIRRIPGTTSIIQLDLSNVPEGSYLIEARTSQGLYRDILIRR